jgi:hypothetical protein
MNIFEATRRALQDDLFLRKRNRDSLWCLHVAAGSVYRNDAGDEVSLDARDCMGDDWYLVDSDGLEKT